MKKSILIIVSIVVSLSLFSFSNQSKALSNNKQSTAPAKDVREVVWSQLPTVDKERIKGTWKDAKVVSKGVLTKKMANGVENKSYIGKQVYSIVFPTTFVGQPNIMLVYADLTTYSFIGKGLVQ
jgi:predicted transcriptional regulator